MSFTEEMFGLKGKVAAVIGGGGVLAGAMATGLAKAGANVAIMDINLDNARARAKEIESYGIRSLALRVDATSKEQIQSANDEILKQLGRVDVVINAPGINSGTPFLEITEEEWMRILNVNLKSIFFSCQVFIKTMVNQGEGGSIINISSASSGPPLSKVFTYSVTKAGINNLTQNLAREYAKQKVRVNAIAPGFFPAEQNRKLLTKERVADIFRHTPMGRFGEAEELVGVVIWLASEKASSFVTGAIIRVDGGFTAMTI